jgi:hypothetical protein
MEILATLETAMAMDFLGVAVDLFMLSNKSFGS